MRISFDYLHFLLSRRSGTRVHQSLFYHSCTTYPFIIPSMSHRCTEALFRHCIDQPYVLLNCTWWVTRHEIQNLTSPVSGEGIRTDQERDMVVLFGILNRESYLTKPEHNYTCRVFTQTSTQG